LLEEAEEHGLKRSYQLPANAFGSRRQGRFY